MKLQLLSDVHLEFGAYEPIKSGDVLIIAGDLAPIAQMPEETFRFLSRCTWTWDEVIYVLGNHEFYDGDYSKVKKVALEWEETLHNLHVLTEFGGKSSRVFELDEYTFIGDTMWTDLSNPVAANLIQNSMNDFWIIWNSLAPRDPYGKRPRWTPNDSTLECFAFQKFLKDFQDRNSYDPNKTVVITHHSPSYLSVVEKYQGDPINAGYHNSIEELVMDFGAKYWFHGHVHDSVDYELGNTRVMTNPRGYVGGGDRENKIFNDTFVVEL